MGQYAIRPMTRCVVEGCRRWWCLELDPENYHCACGGALETVDMDEHIKAIPRAVDEKPPEKP